MLFVQGVEKESTFSSDMTMKSNFCVLYLVRMIEIVSISNYLGSINKSLFGEFFVCKRLTNCQFVAGQYVFALSTMKDFMCYVSKTR